MSLLSPALLAKFSAAKTFDDFIELFRDAAAGNRSKNEYLKAYALFKSNPADNNARDTFQKILWRGLMYRKIPDILIAMSSPVVLYAQRRAEIENAGSVEALQKLLDEATSGNRSAA